MPFLRPARRSAGSLLAVSALAALSLSGCSQLSPQTTTNVTYAPSDGVQGELGQVKVRNLIVLTVERGDPAELIGSLVNDSGEDVELTLAVDGTQLPERLEVPAGEVVVLGPQGDEEVAVEGLDVVIGRTVPVVFVDGEGQLELAPPVLDGTLEEYAELLGEG